MNHETTLFEKLEKHVFAEYRQIGGLNKEIDQCIEKYKKIYEANVEKEKEKLLFLTCESLLQLDDREKLHRLIEKYCSLDEIKTWLQNYIVYNTPLVLISKQSNDEKILVLKTLSNVFEFILNEFGIDERNVYKIQGKEKECVKITMTCYVIEMMKLFYNKMYISNSNEYKKQKRKNPIGNSNETALTRKMKRRKKEINEREGEGKEESNDMHEKEVNNPTTSLESLGNNRHRQGNIYALIVTFIEVLVKYLRKEEDIILNEKDVMNYITRVKS